MNESAQRPYTEGMAMIICKVCYDGGGGDKSVGARFGPKAIERAFKEISWREAEDGTPYPKLQWMRAVASLKQYRKQIESLFTSGPTPFITLSGDNSCSFETVRSVAQHVEYTALAVLDAHPDACDAGHNSHAHWVRRLWDEKIIMPEKTIFFGIRDAEHAEAKYIKEKNAVVINVDEAHAFCLGHTNAPAILRHMFPSRLSFSQHGLVIVVDIDVLDPAYAPGTGVLRAGGLGVRHILHAIREFCALPFAVRIGEICEVIPQEGNNIRPKFQKRPDPCGLTVLAAEAILREMIRSMSV